MKTILIANQKGGCGKTLTAITLASALAHRGFKVALADSDNQKSSLQWLKQRPEHAVQITGLDWRDESSIGEVPKKTDWLIIDAPGALSSEKAQQLIAESHAIVVPLQPSFFDIDSTKRFLKNIDDIKRVRKGKTEILLLANRVKNLNTSNKALDDFFKKIDRKPIASIQERSAYAQLAMEGLSIFDKNQKPFLLLQQQWEPLLRHILGQNTQDNIQDWF